MEKELVTFEVAYALKHAGFDEDCLFMFRKGGKSELVPGYKRNLYCEPFELARPFWQQAISFIFSMIDFKYPYATLEIYSDGSGEWDFQIDNWGFGNLESPIKKGIEFGSLEEAILRVLEHFKN
jgi:hypothetical protein